QGNRPPAASAFENLHHSVSIIAPPPEKTSISHDPSEQLTFPRKPSPQRCLLLWGLASSEVTHPPPAPGSPLEDNWLRVRQSPRRSPPTRNLRVLPRAGCKYSALRLSWH